MRASLSGLLENRAKAEIEGLASLLSQSAFVSSIGPYGSSSTGIFENLTVHPRRSDLKVFDLDILIKVKSFSERERTELASLLTGNSYEAFQAQKLTRWGQDFEFHFFEKTVVENDLPLHFELHVVDEKFVSISTFWKDVFSPIELESQKTIRAGMAERSQRHLYRAVKDALANEGRWRILAALAQGRLGDKSRSKEFNCPPPFLSLSAVPVPTYLEMLIQRFIEGDTLPMDCSRSSSFFKIKEFPIEWPKEPEWVTAAELEYNKRRVQLIESN